MHALLTSEKVVPIIFVIKGLIVRSWWQPIPYVAAVSGGLVKASGLCSAGLGWAGGCKLVQVQLRHRRGEVASNHQQLPGEHRLLARAEPDPRHHGQVLRREVLEREEALQVRAGHLLQQAGPADLPLAHGPRSGEQTNRLEPFLSGSGLLDLA